MRIIVGLIEHLGDIVACEPVARYLKANHPDAHLCWAVLPSYRELIDANPFVDETAPVECLTDWMRLSNHGGYDKVVDLHANYRVCEHCRIPLVKKTGNPFISAYEWFDYGSILEAFSLGAGLPKLSAQPQVYIGPEHVAAVDALHLPQDFCVIHRESNDLVKAWTDEGWLKTVTFLREELGLSIVDVGDGRMTKPSPLEGEIIDLFNRLPILQTAEVIRRASLFVGVDGGPAHLANAVRTPGVVLLGRHGPVRKYTPYTGYYASSSPGVKLVRNLNGNVSELPAAEVMDAARYVVTASALKRSTNVAMKADPLARSVTPLTAADRTLILDSGLFDAGWYLLHTPELDSGEDPLEHFLTNGLHRDLSPGPAFDAAFYLNDNPDVADSGFNSLLHYLRFGRAEGRRSSGAPTGLEREPRPFSAEPISAPGAGLLDESEYPRTFAFYLPQFHPIPENDWAHEKGFVEWHNVVRAKPLFRGHDQPRVPGELGFYDLRAPEVIDRQVELAKAHGVSGFCFYYYYFKGKKLLYDPIKTFLESDHDFPFMFLWANENWSKRWDGGDKEVIIAQEYSREDDLVFLRELAPVFADPRYAKVDGKPILMVYRAQLFEDPKATVETWRQEIEALGFPGLYLVMVDDWGGGVDNPRGDFGFDASYEIPSNRAPEQVLYDEADQLDLVEGFEGRIVDYTKFAAYHMGRPAPPYKRFRTVMLPWDNTARYGRRAMVQVNGHGGAYRAWLLSVLLQTFRRNAPQERIVFLHSWNEWCEGTYLEPDSKNGRWFLEQTRDAMSTARQAIDWANDPAMAEPLAEILNAAADQERGKYYTFQAMQRQQWSMADDLEQQRRDAAEQKRSLVEVEAERDALQTALQMQFVTRLARTARRWLRRGPQRAK